MVGVIKDNTAHVGHGYFWTMAFFAGINVVGLLLNLSLYYIDVNENDSVLDKVDMGSEAPESEQLNTEAN